MCDDLDEAIADAVWDRSGGMITLVGDRATGYADDII